MATHRSTVDLSGFPDLVVIYLGMKALDAEGSAALQAFSSRIAEAVAGQPPGLLAHEVIGVTQNPPGAVFRQYWRDFAALEAWVRSDPHRAWWVEFLRDPKGTEFWHETYFMRGGMEAIYDNANEKIGFKQFAPSHTARGPMFSARQRLGLAGQPEAVVGAAEHELYPEKLA
jgi:heme-degrading monooxygenase HmoA